MVSGVEGIALLHHLYACGVEMLEELRQILCSLCRAYDAERGIAFEDRLDGTRMVGLEMVEYKVIRCAALKRVLNLCQPFSPASGVDGIEEDGLVVEEHVGIVAHSGGSFVLALKKREVCIVASDVPDGGSDEVYHCSYWVYFG